jgi:hypothetical protein
MFTDGCQRTAAVRKPNEPLSVGSLTALSNKRTIKKFCPKGGNNFLLTFFLIILNRMAARNVDIRWPVMMANLRLAKIRNKNIAVNNFFCNYPESAASEASSGMDWRKAMEKDASHRHIA